MQKILLASTFFGLVACGQSAGTGSDEPGLMGSDGTPSTRPPGQNLGLTGGNPSNGPVVGQGSPATPTNGSLSGSDGLGGEGSIPPNGSNAVSPSTPIDGDPPVASATGSETTGGPSGTTGPSGPDATDGGGPNNGSGGNGASGAEAPGGAGGATENSGGATSSGGGGALPSEGAGGSASSEPEPEPPTFGRPEGTIPNSPQPESAVDIDRDDWRQGLVSPTLLDGHQINQPAVVNGYLVVAGNENFWIYDVSDPTSPDELSTFVTPNRRAGGEAESHSVSFARYGDNYYAVTVGGTGIDTWDVSDASAPQHLGQLRIDGVNYGDYTEAVWGVTWQGQYIYVGATNNGIKVVDATDPASLDIVAEVPTSEYGGVSAGPLEAVGTVLVVMTPKESGGVATLDISDPTNPTRLASFSANKSYIGAFYRRWVFMIDPIRVWDVLSDPRNIGSGNSPIGTLPNEGSEYLSFSDGYLFLGHVREEISGTPGASKIRVSDPGNMAVEGRIWGRMDRGGVNDDQFSVALGNLLVLGDDQAPYAGWVIAVHQAAPDSIAPEVDIALPNDQATDVPTTARIGVSFSDNIELATVNEASFIVRPEGGEPLTGKFGVRMGVINFDPDEDLEPGTTYEVVLPEGGITDLVGNALASEWTSTFTTE
jgi:hypothetical protein